MKKIGEHLKFLIWESIKDSITYMMERLKEMKLKSIKKKKEKEFKKLILDAYKAMKLKVLKLYTEKKVIILFLLDQSINLYQETMLKR